MAQTLAAVEAPGGGTPVLMISEWCALYGCLFSSRVEGKP